MPYDLCKKSGIDVARREAALLVRIKAALLSQKAEYSGDETGQTPNGDETRFASSLIGSFTKGLPHDRCTGIIQNVENYELFKKAINTGDPEDIIAVPLGPNGMPFRSAMAQNPEVSVRGWESMAAGLTFDLEGPDAQRPAMPPAPKLDSIELAYEMTELYWMSLLRDVPFINFIKNSDDSLVKDATNSLNCQQWVQNPEANGPLSKAEENRRVSQLSTQTVFRGILKGDNIGPYISQFLLLGSVGLGEGNTIDEGFIQYGSTRIDQRVRRAVEKLDYMTSWGAWIDVQNAADVRGRELYMTEEPLFRLVTTPRDLATFVHFDALYQAYLNACLLLLGLNVPPSELYDSGLPFIQKDSKDHQTGFVNFGTAHILSLVTEVATRALKAVRFQKFNTHRRPRPEAVAALIDGFKRQCDKSPFQDVETLHELVDSEVLCRVGKHNNELNNTAIDQGTARKCDFDPVNGESCCETFLLPMAFTEGSPMHPSYGAGHATVAGACTTILKAFFNHELVLSEAFVPIDDGTRLKRFELDAGEKLTVEGELNKICSNISIGRNWAGVHWRSDYIESVKVGEEIALGILREQKLTYVEDFFFTVPLFDNTIVKV